MEKFLTLKYFKIWKSLLDLAIEDLFSEVKEKEWTADNFRFYTAVSVISSSKIEGEPLEVVSIGSENYYYQNLQTYYNNLARTGLFYDELEYEKGLPFLLMLPNALITKK
jgi:hypothetical protein